MSWSRLAINTSLVVASCFFAILLVEVIFKFVPKRENIDIYHWDYRYMLFSNSNGGSSFNNIRNFFVYQPNATIHNKTFYLVNEQWIKEYDYLFPSNNFGLVQTNNIQANVPSILLLGDSYTEGQGAPPWFELFKKSYQQKSLQPINGGLVGTGFQQWKFLHDYLLSKNIIVKKLVVIFISGDYVRNVWNFPDYKHACLADYSKCVGNEDFYGMPPDDKLNEFLGVLRGYREKHLYKKDGAVKKLLHRLFPGTRLALKYLRESLKQRQSKDAINILANREAIRQFIATYSNNVLFVHIPQKDEILNHAVSPLGKMLRNDIEVFGGKYYDGQILCGLTKGDFFENDGHPNVSGYSKISACVTDAVNKTWQ